MKYSNLTLPALLLGPACALASVTEVLLYPGEATITRTHSVELKEGSSELHIENLPPGIRKNSLRVSINQANGAILGQTELKRIPLSESRAPHIHDLEERLQALKDKIRMLNDKRRSAKLRLKLAQRTAGQGDNPTDSSTFHKLGTAIENDAKGALHRIREIDFQKRDLNSERQKIKSELNRYRSGGNAAHVLDVAYHSDNNQQALVSLQYQTHDAGWQSRYDARLDTANEQLSVTHRALITQTTGEDWHEVDLRLSTGRANLGGNLPNPRPWVLTPKRRRQARAESMKGFASDSLASSSRPRASAQAKVENQGMTQRFRVEGARDIDDGTHDQAITLSHHDMQSDVTTQLVPSMSDRAYIHAEADYGGETPLPAARVNLYQDGQYIGEKTLPALSPGDDLTMAFGVDQRITVETIPETRRRGNEGLISTSHVVEKVTRHDITNHHPHQVNIRVYERLPVSNHDDIEVEHHDVSKPYSDDPDERQGVIVWKRTLNPEQMQQLRYGFTVRVPEGSKMPVSITR